MPQQLTMIARVMSINITADNSGSLAIALAPLTPLLVFPSKGDEVGNFRTGTLGASADGACSGPIQTTPGFLVGLAEGENVGVVVGNEVGVEVIMISEAVGHGVVG